MKVWHYTVRLEPGEWACVMLREDGFFAATSSFGNYAHLWRRTGCNDFREFFADRNSSWSYFAGKLAPEKVTDVEASFRSAKQSLLERRRGQDLTAEKARELFDLLEVYESNGDWDGYLDDPDVDAEEYEHTVQVYNADVQSFTKRILPKLADIVRDELRRPKVEKIEIVAKRNFHGPLDKKLDAVGDVRGDRWYPDRGTWSRLPTNDFEGLQEYLKTFEGTADAVFYMTDGSRLGYRLKGHRLDALKVQLTLVD